MSGRSALQRTRAISFATELEEFPCMPAVSRGLVRKLIRRIYLAIAILIVLDLCATRVRGDVNFDLAMGTAQKCVVQVIDDPNQGTSSRGSGVVLEANPQTGVITVATCAHVVVGMKQPQLYLFVPAQGLSKLVDVVRARFNLNDDAALLQANWADADVKVRAHLESAPQAAAPPKGFSDPLEGKQAYAAGFAYYKRDV